jgi:hypothetical protein
MTTTELDAILNNPELPGDPPPTKNQRKTLYKYGWNKQRVEALGSMERASKAIDILIQRSTCTDCGKFVKHPHRWGASLLCDLCDAHMKRVVG